MKRSPVPNQDRLGRSAGRYWLLAVATLAAWLTRPLRADVIDDFSNGRKFIMHGVEANPDWQLADGQLVVNQPVVGTYSAFYYLRNYELREGQPVEFRVDLVSRAPGDGYAGLYVAFSGAPFLPRSPDRGYILYRLQDGFLLERLWDGAYRSYFNIPGPSLSQPETMSLILTREGTGLRVQARVVLRDEAGTVLLLRENTDRSPPQTPVSLVLINCATISNPSSTTFDNLTCSADPTPRRVSIQRQGGAATTVGWSGFSIPVEAPSLAGPWSPCAVALTQDATGRGATMACDGTERYFRLVPGRHLIELFNDADANWATAAQVAGRVARPSLNVSGGKCRIRGVGGANEDFVMRYGADVGLWYTDCVASVDILDWDDTMVGAAFGMYLRVNAEQDLWFPTTAGLPPEHYAGMVLFRSASSPLNSAITITGPGDSMLASKSFPLLNPDKQYRLQFCAVGSRLTLALFDLEDLKTPVATCQKVDSRIPKGLSALGGRRARGGQELYDVTIDRFLLNGVAP